MADEAVNIEYIQPLNAVRRTCDDDTTISAGALLELHDSNQVSGSSATSAQSAFGGIAAEMYKAGSGLGYISVYMDGVFDLKNDPVLTANAGAPVVISGANTIAPAVAADLLTGAVVGYLEEDAAAAEVVRVRLRGS